MLADDYSDVYLWEEGTHVDCEKEFDGEVLGFAFDRLGTLWVLGGSHHCT